MKKPLAAFVLTCAFATTLLFGQTPTPTPSPSPAPPNPAQMIQRRIQRLTTLLNLTTDQQTQATTFFTNAANTATPLMTSLKTAHQNLQTAIHNNDLNGINQISTQIGNLTAQLTTAVSVAEAQFYHILTPDQQTKLNSLKGRGHHGMGPMGFGPGGPGPGGPGGRGRGPRHDGQ
jgi:Spy/CpxP family protein refolding chaperone